MPFSARLGTPLSNFEANLNYRDVDDPSLDRDFSAWKMNPKRSLVAWTTTPWTLPSNLGVAVHPELDYVKIVSRWESIYRGRSSAGREFQRSTKCWRDSKEKPSKRNGISRFSQYFVDRQDEKSFRVLTDDFVTIEDGTGIVHLAPAFGEVDFFICQREGIEPVCPIDQNGRFTAEVPDYRGDVCQRCR